MSTLERQSVTTLGTHNPAESRASDDAGLAAARAEAGNLAVAGRDAIRRALSENSSEFIRNARQEGGE